MDHEAGIIAGKSVSLHLPCIGTLSVVCLDCGVASQPTQVSSSSSSSSQSTMKKFLVPRPAGPPAPPSELSSRPKTTGYLQSSQSIQSAQTGHRVLSIHQPEQSAIVISSEDSSASSPIKSSTKRRRSRKKKKKKTTKRQDSTQPNQQSSDDSSSGSTTEQLESDTRKGKQSKQGTSAPSDDESSSETSSIIEGALQDTSKGFRELWLQKLEELHQTRMSSKYVVNMIDEEGDFDFERDADYSMSILLPWTVSVMTASHRPTEESLKLFKWLDTSCPGVYLCVAKKTDFTGKVTAICAKVGCAWSVAGGLKARKAGHLDDKQSKREAAKGSPFHMFIQSTDKATETLELKWYTLAVGEKFVRVSPSDEHLAARLYQVEAMLAAAFGALHQPNNDQVCNNLQWWPFPPEDDIPWAGADSHCSLQDTWNARPGSRTGNKKTKPTVVVTPTSDPLEDALIEDSLDNPQTEEEKRQLELANNARFRYARRAHEGKAGPHVCPLPGCVRSVPGQGLTTEKGLEMHLKSHERADKRADDRKSVAKCSDPRCGYSTPNHPEHIPEHEKQHIDGKFACGACGLRYRHAWMATDHAKTECKVEYADEIHVPEEFVRQVTCDDERCSQEWFNTDKGRALRDQHRISQHQNGKFVCGICGMRYRAKYPHPGKTNGGVCPGYVSNGPRKKYVRVNKYVDRKK